MELWPLAWLVMLSPGSVFGGVRRLPTLVMLPADGAEDVLYVGYLCCMCDSGGGSSTFGKLDAADLRAVKLGGAPRESDPECIICIG